MADGIWNLVTKARRKAKGDICALGAILEKSKKGDIRRSFNALRKKVPTLEKDSDAQAFYDEFRIYPGGDDEADYAHAVIEAGKRVFQTFVNPKTTWARRAMLARTKMCIKPGGHVWWGL